MDIKNVGKLEAENSFYRANEKKKYHNKKI